MAGAFVELVTKRVKINILWRITSYFASTYFTYMPGAFVECMMKVVKKVEQSDEVREAKLKTRFHSPHFSSGSHANIPSVSPFMPSPDKNSHKKHSVQALEVRWRSSASSHSPPMTAL